ncbi:uncharacterized protein LOC112092707 [Morus notabilis]|uniref:uncharacterized protein LOC112092707 n=1 Tax=Morus notabilis TaxID=981085 RepID=UPI000CED75AC|nr:uncharacterized protein LOC112092707 [Morus notabilis]
MAKLEKQIGNRLNNFERVVGKVAEAVNVNAKMYTSHDHPFTENIIRVPLPDKYKPPPIPLYDGRSDPDDHLEVYTGHMVLHGYPEEVMCCAFKHHLSDSARRWFRSLKPNLITSWDDLKNAFLTQFIGVKKYIPPKHNLSRVYQGPNESLKDWIARFGEQVAATERISDEVALMGALSSIKKDITYNTDLNRRPPQTYQEFMARAQGFINAEETKKALKSKVVVPTKEEVGQSSQQSNNKKRQGNPQVQVELRYNPAPNNRDVNASTGQGDTKRAKPQKYDTYTLLTIGIEDVYHEINHLQVLRCPPPLKSDPARRNQNKYCRFHGDSGHMTSECFDLKDEVERLIPKGWGNSNQRNNDRREDQRQFQPPEPVGVIRMIFGGPYLGGASRRAQKEYAREAKEKFNRRIMSVSGKESKAAKFEEAEITFS